MAIASVEGTSVARLTMSVPAWGTWWADVDLTEAVELFGVVEVKIADVIASGAVVSGGVADGRAAYRIVGGRGGWGKEIGEQSYNDDLGVKASKVLTDAANAAGEVIADVPTTRLARHFARAKGLASSVLHLLAPQAWYTDFEGVTRFGARPETTYTGNGSRTRISKAARVVEIATEEIAALVPGVIVDDSPAATDVEYVLDDKRLTARVYYGATTTRRLSALAKIVEALDPNRKYRGVFEFRVVLQIGDRVHLQPVRAATGLPVLMFVPVRPGMPGMKATYTPGARVLVAFVDSDPSRPCVIAHDEVGTPGWMPLFLDFGDTDLRPIAKVGDPIVGGGGGVIGAAPTPNTRIRCGV